MELIDDIVTKGEALSRFKVINVDGKEYTGWVCAKPINPRLFRTRLRDAVKVLRGEAIAIQYFDDLTEQEKQNYVKTQVK